MSWTPHHPGDASNERQRADELFAELSRIDRAPDELTARVMGQVGYRPVTTLEARRRRRTKAMLRAASFVVLAGVLAASALHLRQTEGRHQLPVTMDSAVAQDVTRARAAIDRTVSRFSWLRPPVAPSSDAATVRPGTPAAVLAADEPEADAWVVGDRRGSGLDRLRADVPGEGDGTDPGLAPPMPRVGPSSFPSGGRGIDRLVPPFLAPRPGAAPGLETPISAQFPGRST